MQLYLWGFLYLWNCYLQKVHRRVSLTFSLEVWKFYIYVSIPCKLIFVQSVTFFLRREIWLIWHYFLPIGIPSTPLEYLIFVKNHLLPLRMDKKIQVLWLDFEISPTGVLVWTLDRQQAARFCRLGILWDRSWSRCGPGRCWPRLMCSLGELTFRFLSQQDVSKPRCKQASTASNQGNIPVFPDGQTDFTL